MRSISIIFAVIVLLWVGADAFSNRLPIHFLHKEPPLPTRRSQHRIETLWVDQILDHFNPRDSRTWKMRYMSNNEHFQPGGPIFIYIGGEWTISEGWLQGGIMYDIAEKHNGYMFYTEHRYYGESLPTPDASTENLQYLHVDQALSDLVLFIHHVKSTIEGLENSKVVLVGASYAASMAAWFKLKYPHLAVGSLASSAPVLAVADFYKYFEVVNEALSTVGSESCVKTINEAVVSLMEEFETEDGPANIAERFNLCAPIQPDVPNDLASFFNSIANTFAGIVQYHWEGDIEAVCEMLDNEELGGPVDRLTAFVKRQWGDWDCTEMDYKSLVEYYLDPVWGNDATLYAGRQWYYQTCTEYGYYQTSLSEDQPFPASTFPVQFFVDLCRDIYGDIFTDGAREILDRGVNRTNIVYGDLSLYVRNVIFTHGSIDPWHAIGILEDINESAPAIIIPGYSHCADLYSLSPYDSKEMQAAKKRVIAIISSWLE